MDRTTSDKSTTKIYLLEIVEGPEVGRFESHDRNGPVIECKVCGVKKRKRIFPAAIEFIRGPVADFHEGLRVYIGKRTIIQDLADRFPGIELKPIQIHTGTAFWSSDEDPKPAKPYHGPELAEIYFPLRIPYNPEHSTLINYFRCSACGFIQAKVDGRERGISILPKRTPGKGIFIPADMLGDNMAFRYGGDRMMVLKPVKEYMERKGYTNIQFLEYGDVI